MPGIDKLNPFRIVDKQFQTKYSKALAYTTLTSIVIKDGYGCYKYTTQSLKNKDIPKDRRYFVASVDLTNGALMIVTQILLFAAMRKFNEPIFDKIFKKSFGEKAVKHTAEKVRLSQVKDGKTSSRKPDIKAKVKDIRKDFLEVFKFVTELAAATIVGKRIVVPFIATPLANKVKGKMEAYDTKNNEAEKTDDIHDIDDIDDVEDDD